MANIGAILVALTVTSVVSLTPAVARQLLASPPPGPASDLVQSIPGYGTLGANMTMYAGRLYVSESNQIFYTFFPAQTNPESAPLLLWFQGGPGCSGLQTTFNGASPLTVTVNGSLIENPYSWTQFANVLTYDTPTPTGFSLPTATAANPSISNDTAVTALNLAVLKQFYAQFPGYASAPVYITGMSYGGHYVPLLAEAILVDNKAMSAAGKSNDTIPLAGIILGNPWTNPATDNLAAANYWYDQGIISNETYTGLLQNCNFSAGALWRTSGPSGMGATCDAFRNTAYDQSGFTNWTIDLYALNEPVCYNGDEPVTVPNGYNSCSDYQQGLLLNNPAVQEALHAISPGQSPLEYSSCVGTGVVAYPPSDLATSMLPVWHRLVPTGNGNGNGLVPQNFTVVIFSGQNDGYVPTSGTEEWVLGLGRPPVDNFTVWTDGTGQGAGWVTSMQGGLAFVAVKDAGHTVPATTPNRAAQLFKAASSGQPLTAETLEAAAFPAPDSTSGTDPPGSSPEADGSSPSDASAPASSGAVGTLALTSVAWAALLLMPAIAAL